MAGIYIHFPFCRKKCHYCNFVSVASQKLRENYLPALLQEIVLQKNFFSPDSIINTIYFGGGTPSLLKPEEIKNILTQIAKVFHISNNAEITFEMNPDDAQPDYLKKLMHLGIHRISIGVQSFHNTELNFLGRTHSSEQSVQSVINAQNAGFENISIDLIYGLPLQHSADPEHNIKQALDLNVQHISAYALTPEPNTIYDYLVRRNTMKPPDEDLSVKHFRFYTRHLKKAGFEHYEISNFARPGFRSKHNSSYWQNKPYLGLGAGAHSYNLHERRSNTPLITEYVTGIFAKNPVQYNEKLSEKDKYNEYIITAIRTSEGISLQLLVEFFGENVAQRFTKKIQKFMANGYVQQYNERYTLSEEGQLWANLVATELMEDEIW